MKESNTFLDHPQKLISKNASLFTWLASYFNYRSYVVTKLVECTLSLSKCCNLRLILLIVIYPMLFVNNANALSAATANVVNGSAPYLSLDGGETKINSAEGLLGITLPNGHYIPPGVNSALYPNATIDTSSASNPIELPSTTTFADIQTMVPVASYPSIELNKLVNSPYNYGKDDDGDVEISATGSLMIQWQDKKGQDITIQVKNHQKATLSACSAPYKLTLTATNVSISTKYGQPKSNTFIGDRYTYHIVVPNMDKPCPSVAFAQPNLLFSAGDESPDLWNDQKGFKVADVSDTTKNFPTTGANKLYFFLLLKNITPEQVIAANGTKVSATNGMGVTLSLSKSTTGWRDTPLSEAALKIELNGPDISSNNKAFTPSLFNIYADSTHLELLYSFKIERWYIIPIQRSRTYDDIQKFCRNLGNGYRVPDANDLTNANGDGWTGGIPSRNVNSYQRRLSYRDSNRWIGGILNEWGYITDTPNNAFLNHGYWVTQSNNICRSDSEILFANSMFGNVNCSAYTTRVIEKDQYDKVGDVCVSP
ncbi:hypothetical protein [Gilliamella sp. ESL0250]|uniref:hypothetical protein n=1 Tax=Gilliamella sp. ESL0250 TaxID=2705036 RepID=UPI001580418C|nr:hypothetical protein [Gilliamella sp. ESL0250]NUF49986.1 hypothetical protein [Gilliamella sp. ESL0250]